MRFAHPRCCTNTFISVDELVSGYNYTSLIQWIYDAGIHVHTHVPKAWFDQSFIHLISKSVRAYNCTRQAWIEASLRLWTMRRRSPPRGRRPHPPLDLRVRVRCVADLQAAKDLFMSCRVSPYLLLIDASHH